jgi:hypothetical protein
MDNTASLDHGGHRYTTLSTHCTSEGRIVYQHCDCGLWRVERYPSDAQPITEAIVEDSKLAWRRQPSAARTLSAI